MPVAATRYRAPVTEDYSGPSYPGQHLGLPESGAGSAAGWGRRVLALVVDWFLSMMAVGTFVGTEIWSGGGAAQWAPLGVFAVQRWVLTTSLGGSAGQLICRIHVHSVAAVRVTAWQVLLRTVLLCLVIPPLITNRDRRGMHDMAAGTVVVCR
ncbi:MAG: RDD family protein [Propionibacteriales bacterium]|nr:RDD family protein [Propionibacteriales bacterium]